MRRRAHPVGPSGEVRGGVPLLLGGGLWLSGGGAPCRGRCASPCPSNGEVMGGNNRSERYYMVVGSVSL